LLIGIIGAPNKGKSTLFSALTLNEVHIANYPFTTISPNFGIAYITKECVEKELHTKCSSNEVCKNGERLIPINLVDVAGLVKGAHEGKGMGNQFLNDLATASAYMLVVDASGKTDPNGNPCESCDPVDDVKIVKDELVEWLYGIVKRHMKTVEKRTDGINALYEILAGLNMPKTQIEDAVNSCGLTSNRINWPDNEIKRFSAVLIEKSKPVLVVANKFDVEGSEKNYEKFKAAFGDRVEWCTAELELALRRAAKNGLIDYTPGARNFTMIKKGLPEDQISALKYMQAFISRKGTNVQNILNKLVFDILNNIVVYPVEDENKYADHFGNILPDAILIKKGSTAYELAALIHTDIAKNMLYAIDAKSKLRLPKNYVLKDNDVIKIVSAAKH